MTRGTHCFARSALLHCIFFGGAFFASFSIAREDARYSVAFAKSSVQVQLLDKPRTGPLVRAPVARAMAQEFSRDDAPGERDQISESPAAAASGGGAITDVSPSPVQNPSPVYPEYSRKRKHQGVVYLAVQISNQGYVRVALIKKSSGFAQLDEAALETVRSWGFQPAMRDGVAVESQVDIPVRFKIEEN